MVFGSLALQCSQTEEAEQMKEEVEVKDGGGRDRGGGGDEGGGGGGGRKAQQLERKQHISLACAPLQWWSK